ncbi:cytosol aminopeptidase-like [Ruditapes philippinarum]|uniref:cytosol aminopeptidase-like n=1 Tax=Ruditapes philippinarum TaxID=129788 RepID=UPI00295B015C|nr:cytosol aminopeptidase-like [Ruditapes philippinarum]
MAASMKVIGRKIHKPVLSTICQHSRFSTHNILNKGAVLGVYQAKEKDGDLILDKSTQFFDDKSSKKISGLLKVVSRDLKKGGCRVLYDVVPGYESVALCCIGEKGASFNEAEGFDEGSENIRAAVASGVKTLRSIGETEVDVDPCGNAEAAAEGGYLSLFEYDELKDKTKRKKAVKLSCLVDHITASSSAKKSWTRGRIKAEGQNWARHLMEMPSNKLTPALFVEAVQQKFANRSNVTIHVRDKSWIQSEKMEAFLAVSQGSSEAPYFLHIEYKHPDNKMSSPVAVVGKGVTFDTGGISIKPAASMDQMRADMGGAACTVGTLYSVDRLDLPVHVHAFIPLCENMPGGRAIKPGDVVTARNGKTIQIDNTDAEGRLILADALNYAETVNPQVILDMATLTGAIDVALGSGAAGVYATSTDTWNILQKAGANTGDRVWRMPLFNHYTKQVTDCKLADVNNIGKHSRSGGSCTAAAFLKEFVTNKNWMHLDIAGVMSNKDEVPYLNSGMAGRPTRTIVEFIEMLSKAE